MAQPVPVHREERPVHSRESYEQLPEPFAQFSELWDRMSRLFEAPWRLGPPGAWAPPVDMEEGEDAYVFELDLPGVRREGVTLEIRDHDLCV